MENVLSFGMVAKSLVRSQVVSSDSSHICVSWWLKGALPNL